MHYSEHESHHILQTVTHFNPESTVTSPSSSPPPTASTRTLPLFVLAKQLNEEGQNCSKHGLHATWSTINCRLESKLEEASVSVEEGKNVSANDGSGRVLGMVYKRFELLKRLVQNS